MRDDECINKLKARGLIIIPRGLVECYNCQEFRRENCDDYIPAYKLDCMFDNVGREKEDE